MKTRNALLLLPVFFTLFSCSKDNESTSVSTMKAQLLNSDTATFLLNFAEELPENNNPVCLRFSIFSKELFPHSFTLVNRVEVKNNSILMNIGSVKDNGECENPLWSSKPATGPDSIKCAASGTFRINSLKRGTYSFDIRMQNQSIALGKLVLTDQLATLALDSGLKTDVLSKNIHIVPDSCIFGAYYYGSKYILNAGNNSHFDELLVELQKINCREISLQAGQYRAFGIDEQGYIYPYNIEKQANEIHFIFKTNKNMQRITAIMADFINRTPEAYGFIFADSDGQNYNIKKPSK